MTRYKLPFANTGSPFTELRIHEANLDGEGLLKVWLILGLHCFAMREDGNHAEELHG